MSGEVRCFRRRLFGFDARDVMEYIAQLAVERNQYKRAGDRLEAEISKIKNELSALQERMAEADRRVAEIGAKSFDSATQELESLKETYEGLRTEMMEIADRLSAEISRLSGSLTGLSAAFDETDSRLREIAGTLTEGRLALSPEDLKPFSLQDEAEDKEAAL